MVSMNRRNDYSKKHSFNVHLMTDWWLKTDQSALTEENSLSSNNTEHPSCSLNEPKQQKQKQQASYSALFISSEAIEDKIINCRYCSRHIISFLITPTYVGVILDLDILRNACITFLSIQLVTEE